MDNSSGHSKQMILPIFIADAFAKKAFCGNGAAVCLVDFQKTLSPDVKQKIATEMNLSETAFVSILKEGDTFEKGNRFSLCWFTPKCEVPLCGHATLASAAVLFLAMNNKSPVLEFETVSGILKARQLPGGTIEIDLPSYESNPVDSKQYERIIKGAVGFLPVQEVVKTDTGKLLIRLQDNVTWQQFRDLRPNSDELLSSTSDIDGVIITLKRSSQGDWKDEQNQPYDFISRYFAPWMGVLEDPVCGSAHSVLGPFWSRILKKNELYAHQCSTRGGDLNVKLVKDKILLSGHAVIVIQGQIQF